MDPIIVVDCNYSDYVPCPRNIFLLWPDESICEHEPSIGVHMSAFLSNIDCESIYEHEPSIGVHMSASLSNIDSLSSQSTCNTLTVYDYSHELQVNVGSQSFPVGLPPGLPLGLQPNSTVGPEDSFGNSTQPGSVALHGFSVNI
jgi:hypothetical protein